MATSVNSIPEAKNQGSNPRLMAQKSALQAKSLPLMAQIFALEAKSLPLMAQISALEPKSLPLLAQISALEAKSLPLMAQISALGGQIPAPSLKSQLQGQLILRLKSQSQTQVSTLGSNL